MLLKKFYPLGQRQGMLTFEPALKGAVCRLKFQNLLGVVDGRLHFKSIADNAGIGKQPLTVGPTVSGYFFDVEAVVGLLEIILLLEDGFPAESRLVDLQQQATEQFIVVVQRKTIVAVVVPLVQSAALPFGQRRYVIAIGHVLWFRRR